MYEFAQTAPLYFNQISLMGALLISALLGAGLGVERSLAGKHAGMRTYALVSLGSCLFVMIGVIASYQFALFTGVNPLQLASSVVVGVGFIGTGLAVFRGDHPSELTTATGLWLAAGVGIACGFGLFMLATSATILGLIIFSLLLKIENYMRARWKPNAD